MTGSGGGASGDGGMHTSASAAEAVQKARRLERTRLKKGGSVGVGVDSKPTSTSRAHVALEMERVSTTAASALDDVELARRQREVHERLEAKQAEVKRTAESLARVRSELASLEVPLKADIMRLRERLEASNRAERVLVDSVNGLRRQLHTKEVELAKIRERKQEQSDELIDVMAKYEKRKAERLEEIAHLVGGPAPSANGQTQERTETAKSTFTGF